VSGILILDLLFALWPILMHFQTSSVFELSGCVLIFLNCAYSIPAETGICRSSICEFDEWMVTRHLLFNRRNKAPTEKRSGTVYMEYLFA